MQNKTSIILKHFSKEKTNKPLPIECKKQIIKNLIHMMDLEMFLASKEEILSHIFPTSKLFQFTTL